MILSDYLKRAILCLTIINSLQVSHAQVTVAGDSFNDNNKDFTKWGADIVYGSGTLTETNSRLEYTCTSAAGTHYSYRPWILNPVPYDRNWEVILDVTNNLDFTSGFHDTGVGIEVFPPDSLDVSVFNELHSSYWGTQGFHGFISGRSEDETGEADYEGPTGSSGSLRIAYNSTTKVLTTYLDADGSSNGLIWTEMSTYGINGSGGNTNASWGMTASSTFRVAIGGFTEGSQATSGKLTADQFTISITDPASRIQTWQTSKFGSSTSPQSALSNDADKDGLSNLMEYAFNLEPLAPAIPILAAANGTSGLPRLTSLGSNSTLRLRMEYLRFKASSNPGIRYTPQFSSDLTASGGNGWNAATGTEIVTSIDTNWERVIIEDTSGTGLPRRYGRVMVTQP